MATPNTHFSPDEIGRCLFDARAIYFLGIGGVSMSSLAQLTARKGLTVGGYDRTASDVTRHLEKMGIRVDYTSDTGNLDGYDAVVYTVAIPECQVEYREAQRRGLPLISRADYMGYLMSDYASRIGFSGTHGKSTASAMCAQIFLDADEDPTVLIGAELPSIGGAFREGGKESMIFEACEYMDSFLDFCPTVAVILNVEMDHVDYFRDMAQMRRSYRAFAEKVGEAGTVICNADDPECRAALDGYAGRVVTFGIEDPAADYRATGIELEHGVASFCVLDRGERLMDVKLAVPGRHNVYNALAAIAAARESGLCSRRIAYGLERFGGIARRMERKGTCNGATVFDDYGHHPTEVRATLEEARLLGEGKLICAFQPHTFSRTAALFDDYVRALRVADRVIIAPIYAARETDTPGVSAEKLAAAVGKTAVAATCLYDAADRIRAIAAPGDTVVVMGAGDIEKIFPRLLAPDGGARFNAEKEDET